MSSELTHAGTLRELSTDQGVLRYHEAGSGPPLLMLHGSGPGVTGWRNFRGNLGAFAEHFRCLVLELPGFGVSDPAEGHPMATAGKSVVRFLDALGLEQVDIVGNSMGGIIATNLAMARADLVRRLVCIGGIGKNLFSPGPGEGINLLRDFTDEPTRDGLVRWLRSMVHDPNTVTEEMIEERWQLATDPSTLASARTMYGSAALAAREAAESDSAPYWAMLHKVKAPTLLAWGRDDRVCPMDMAVLPMRTLPRGELHVFPNCGHWVMIEQKAAFENAALAFLTRPEQPE